MELWPSKLRSLRHIVQYGRDAAFIKAPPLRASMGWPVLRLADRWWIAGWEALIQRIIKHALTVRDRELPVAMYHPPVG